MGASNCRKSSIWTVLFPALCLLLGSATQAKAQLWDVPPLPAVPPNKT